MELVLEEDICFLSTVKTHHQLGPSGTWIYGVRFEPGALTKVKTSKAMCSVSVRPPGVLSCLPASKFPFMFTFHQAFLHMASNLSAAVDSFLGQAVDRTAD